MCGIFGCIEESSKAKKILIKCLNGLKKLEYRGYDSAGIASIENGRILQYKTTGKVHSLDKNIINTKDLSLAIGHTRWATHGAISEKNAHPHTDTSKSLSLVHNGIIENYKELQYELKQNGIHCISDTDSEVLTQLIAYYFKGNMIKALQTALDKIEGSFAIALIHKDFPDTIFASSRDAPLVIGKSKNTIQLSSDVHAFSGKTMKATFLADNEIASITHKEITVYNEEGKKKEKEDSVLHIDPKQHSKGPYPHFMLKEIFEQKINFSKSVDTFLTNDNLHHEIRPILETNTDQILIIACGSSYHAGLIVSSMIEELLSIPTQVRIASELRYQSPALTKNTLAIAISQSGETCDTLGAVKNIKNKKLPVFAICNVKGSTLTRIADHTLYIDAGPEISVCSTKAFSAQLTLLQLLVLHLTKDNLKKNIILSNLTSVKHALDYLLSHTAKIEKLAKKYSLYEKFFFIGRDVMYPTAMEASLKLKEITYLMSIAYPAGEMKHGPIALIDSKLVTIALCGNEKTLGKITSNLIEIKSRNGPILAFCPKGSKEIEEIADDTFFLPNNLDDFFSPLIYSIALQLFAYFVAIEKKTDIDQPRNLAKSVTVE